MTSSLLALASLAHATERRELGRHEHGVAKLNLAVEGTRVVMEVEAPGLDVLGFEHAPVSDADKAAAASGRAALAQPLDLFVLPAAAGCKVVESSVELLHEKHDHDEDAAADAEHVEDAAADDHDDHALHSEFRGSYTLDCDHPAEMTKITFVWFDRFPNAKKVDVTLVTTENQTSYVVNRGDPPLTIGDAS
jgi:hypothetical protein